MAGAEIMAWLSKRINRQNDARNIGVAYGGAAHHRKRQRVGENSWLKIAAAAIWQNVSMAYRSMAAWRKRHGRNIRRSVASVAMAAAAAWHGGIMLRRRRGGMAAWHGK